MNLENKRKSDGIFPLSAIKLVQIPNSKAKHLLPLIAKYAAKII